MITALSETSSTSLKEKIFCHKTRPPFKNSLQKSHKLIRLFNYAPLASLSVRLPSLKLEVKTNWPHQKKSRLPSQLSISPPPPNLICLLPRPLPFIPGLILCALKNNLSSPSLLFNLQSIILSFVFSSEPISWVVVSPLSSARYRWPTCVLREVMLFDHSSLFPCLPTVTSGAGVDHNHKATARATGRKCLVHVSVDSAPT